MQFKDAAFSLLVCFAASAALAGDTAWKTFIPNGGGSGAGICPLDDDETGNLFCVTVFCEGGGPLELSFSFLGGRLSDRVSGTILVDGEVAGRIEWPRTAQTEYEEYAVLYAPQEHSDLVRALQAGNSAEIVLEGEGFEVRQPFALRGSSRSIGAALSACPVAPEPAAREPLSDASGAEVASAPQPAAGSGATTVTENDPSISAWLAGELGIASPELQSFFFSNGSEGLGFLYYFIEGSAGSFGIAVGYFRHDGTSYAFAGRVNELFGTSPRDVSFDADAIAVTTTTLAPGDPRCCPTGEGNWRIDRSSLLARER